MAPRLARRAMLSALPVTLPLGPFLPATNEYLSDRRSRMLALMEAERAGLEVVKSAPLAPDVGVVICPIRDELVHLPHFLGHYRAAGVKRFAFIDNGSADGSVAFLLGEADCDLYRHRGDYRKSGCGTAWINLLLRAYAAAPWLLCVDADEHAVYDGWPARSLDDFARRASRAGRSVVTALMVDMYGPGAVLETRVAPGQSLRDACPLFDGAGYAIRAPEDWREGEFPRLSITGGPEHRVFGVRTLFGWLAKTPLILEPDLLFIDPHTVLPVGLNFARPQMALLHFRFFDNLKPKTDRVVARGQHSRVSLGYYDAMAKRLAAEPDFSFAWEGSVRFTSPADLIDRGMIRGGH